MDLRELANKLEKINVVEDKGHLDHPEDLVFLQDVAGVDRAIKAIEKTIKEPTSITIKWDGYPALIFGRGVNGKFTIMDKHMFNKGDGTGRVVYSPQQFRQYDIARGVDRSDLHRLVAEIWPGLAKASKQAKGYYWGDLLFSHPLRLHDNQYKFKANPNGITYTVEPNSNVGKLMANKIAGIAVHQHLDATAPNTDAASSLNGTIGQLKNNSNIAIVPSKMPITPKLKLDARLMNEVKAAILKYGDDIVKLMDTAPQARGAFNQLFTVYINRKIISGNLNNLLPDFVEFVHTRPMTESMRSKIDAHLAANKEGLVGAFTVWADLYKLKMSIVEQLNNAVQTSPVKGHLQDGRETHEGFVSQGLKFVDRMGFSRQNLSAR